VRETVATDVVVVAGGRGKSPPRPCGNDTSESRALTRSSNPPLRHLTLAACGCPNAISNQYREVACVLPLVDHPRTLSPSFRQWRCLPTPLWEYRRRLWRKLLGYPHAGTQIVTWTPRLQIDSTNIGPSRRPFPMADVMRFGAQISADRRERPVQVSIFLVDQDPPPTGLHFAPSATPPLAVRHPSVNCT
jgi:hypothetical protein